MTDRVSVQSVLPDVSFDATPSPLQAQFIEIKATPHAAQSATDKGSDKSTDKPGEKVETGDALFNQVLSIKPQEFGPGFKDAQAAAKAFMTVPDKAEALEKGKPAFEAAIKTSDSDYIAAIGKYSPDYNIARSDVRDAQIKTLEAVQGLKGVFAKMPEDKREGAQTMMALMQSDVSPALKASLRKELGQIPDFLKNYDKTDAAIKGVEAAAQKMEKAAQPIMFAAREQAATRYIYSHALELAGDKSQAYLVKQEGQGKLADAAEEYLNKPKPPQKLLSV